jgi:hypothetical protein
LRLFAQTPASQVVHMPSGLNQNDRSARHQAGIRHAFKPALQPAPVRFAVRIHAALDRIVDEQQLCTASGYRSTRAHGVVGTAREQTEPMRGRTVAGQPRVRKDPRE